MRRFIIFIFIVLCTGLSSAGWAALNIDFTIDTTQDRTPISPYIYGANYSLGEDENIAARRTGGNRLTGYNWENNFSNAGNDWYHSNDNYLVSGLPWAQQQIPGICLTKFQDSCLAAGEYSLVTLQMAGFVSADGDGTVTEVQTAPSDRWKEVVYAKPAPFCDPAGEPNVDDDYVYMDECVNFLVDTYGNASTPMGVKAYSLDNEPALWPSTHPRIHPNQTGCAELVNRSVALSSAVKDVDPTAKIFGPALYGFAAYNSFQDAPDWSSVKNGYSWFIDYYLAQMKLAETMQGRRLLDVLDLHWYPEAIGDGERITNSLPSYSRTNAEARMQAPRTLWDPDYIEDSWIAQWFSSYLPLLPEVQNSIDTYYPGTALAITEFTYGAPEHFSGGIAMADALGIFGKYGLFMSSYWGDSNVYVSAAYKIYRNYDGSNSTFGDTKVNATMSDKENSSIYASIFGEDDTQLHIIVINKNYDESINGSFDINSPSVYASGRVWAFNSTSSVISEITPVSSITGNSFSYTIAPLTVCHIILETQVDELPSQATNPNPQDTATDVSRIIDLTWTAGTYAASHDVYLGTDFNDVNDANASSDEFKGNKLQTTFDPGLLARLTTYYWRIDEKNILGTTKGQVWRFTTADESIPIEFDAASSGFNSSAGTTLSWSHTIGGGNNRVLVVGIAAEDSSPNDLTINSVTYNGVDMDPIPGTSSSVGTSYLQKTELYYLLDNELPSAGSYSVVITYSGSVDNINGGAISLTNVAQQPVEAVAVNANTSSSTISTNITTLTNGAWVIDVVGCGNSGSFSTTTGGMQERWDVSASSASGAGSTKPVASAGLTTMSWQQSGANRLAHSLAAFAPLSCPTGDIDGDCEVGWEDLRILAENWLVPDGSANLDGINDVDFRDFALLAQGWGL